jgi:hypothetical protein
MPHEEERNEKKTALIIMSAADILHNEELHKLRDSPNII